MGTTTYLHSLMHRLILLSEMLNQLCLLKRRVSRNNTLWRNGLSIQNQNKALLLMKVSITAMWFYCSEVNKINAEHTVLHISSLLGIMQVSITDHWTALQKFTFCFWTECCWLVGCFFFLMECPFNIAEICLCICIVSLGKNGYWCIVREFCTEWDFLRYIF